MSISGIGSQTSLIVQSLVDTRRQLDDLQRQLGTGKKSDTYAGLGLDRGLAVGLRAHVASLGGFDNAITNVGVRINLAQVALGRISDVTHQVKAATLQPGAIDSNGSTNAQLNAYLELGEILGLLNTQAGDRYLFSGRSTDQPAVETLDHVMNGDGARAGLKQITAERKQADLGANGLGRLLITAPTTFSVRLREDVVSPFGLKLAGVTSNLANATVTPSGPPTGTTVDLTAGNPNDGDTIEYRFTLPDGSTESITLTATSLTAASAVAAAGDFFNVDAGQPPQRVAGPPFDTATAFVAGTPADTVTWYTGEMGTDPARATATASVDTSITVSYGLRANEQGLRWVVQNVAALAAITFSQSDPNAAERSAALNQRIGTALAVPAGTQKVEDIEGELAGAQTTLAAASDRHRQTKATLSDMLEQIEGVSNEEVASTILALQTRLQASLQTTALLYQTSLVRYL